MENTEKKPQRRTVGKNKPYIIAHAYDKEKYKTTRNGVVSKGFQADDPDVDRKVQEWKDEIKRKNEEFVRKIKSGEIVPVPTLPRNTKVVEMYKPSDVDTAPMVETNVDTTPSDVAVPTWREAVPTWREAVAGISRASRIPTIADRTKFKLLLDPGTGNTTFILGSSKSGKSTALMKIYDKYYADDKNLISILWTQNPQIKLYRGHRRLLKCGVWNAEGEELIKTEKRIQTATKNKYKFLNIFDDILNVRNNALMDNMILSYRNSKMSSIISLQYSNMMSKCGRANCNNILAFSFNTDEAIEVVIKTFLAGYCSRMGIRGDDRINWYKSMTRDHGFIYIKPAEDHVSFHKFAV